MESLRLVLAGGGPWAAIASAVGGQSVDRAALHTAGFRFVHLTSYRDVNFLPGAVKYGDLPGLLALRAPGKLWLAGENGQLPPILSAAYRAAGHPDNVASHAAETTDVPAAAVEWLLK